jgi:hypothetical protein
MPVPMEYKDLFSRLWKDYTRQNPFTLEVYNLLTAEGETVVNDHVAFRTFAHPSISIDILARPFINAGYVAKGEYKFEQKKLFARHLEHRDDPDAPRVFISELLYEEFSPYFQQTIRHWIHGVPECLLGSSNIVFSGNASLIPSLDVYNKLRAESEYAAWLYVNGFRANHFTVSVNHLKKFDTIQKVNEFLKSKGFALNDAGGEIQGTPADLLEQSSIKAGMVTFKFLEGQHEIPGCYYEFARRYPDAGGKLYSGFVAKSADKIFQSTDFYTKKP